MTIYLNQILILDGKYITPFPLENTAAIVQLFNFLLLITTDLERYIISSERSIPRLMSSLDPTAFRVIDDRLIVSRKYEDEFIGQLN